MLGFAKNKLINFLDGYRPQTEDFMVDNGLYTDRLVKSTIKWSAKQECDQVKRSPEQELDMKKKFADELREEDTVLENQPTILPLTYSPFFFEQLLGDWMKFSCGYFNDKWDTCESSSVVDLNVDLSQAEENMMEIYCERADIEDGMNILDLSAGYGSFSLYVAQKYPSANVTAITEVPRQAKWISDKMKLLEIDNINCITTTYLELTKTYGPGFESKFDRIIAVDILRYTYNWHQVIPQILDFLNPRSNFGESFLFVQDSCHKDTPRFSKNSSFMERHFSAGSMIMSPDLLFLIDGVTVVEQWLVNGKQFQRSANLWLQNMDKHKKDIIRILEKESDLASSIATFNRWRIYFLTISESYGYNQGSEWMIAHYLITK